MNEQYHIIIAGDQHSPITFQISKKRLLFGGAITLFVLSTFTLTGLFTSGIYAQNKYLSLRLKMNSGKMESILAENQQLESDLAQSKKNNTERFDKLKKENALLLSKMELESNRAIAELERKNLEQQMSFKEKRDLLLSTAVNELNQRSEFIENVITDLGIKVKQKTKATSAKNSGGPFVAAENATYDKLLYKADSYLKTIQTLPLGKPVKGSVSSWYGKRQDPINKKKAFHEGIDFRGRKGDPIYATADGKVVFAGKNGGFGNFVKINHGNGYTTSFAHMDNYHVKKGNIVTRGQVIGLVGNSGRSTGSHLHYEIAYKGKHINPAKFMKVASLTCKFDTTQK